MVIVLGALQEALAAFSNPMEALKMVFGVRSIRVFSKFSLDPYYEPLPWFMIALNTFKCLLQAENSMTGRAYMGEVMTQA